jgi:Meckel syndrome type 1 protein
MDFEALLAGLFGAVDPAVTAAAAAAEAADAALAQEDEAAAEGQPSAEAQSLAALLIASQQQAQPTPPQPATVVGETVDDVLAAAGAPLSVAEAEPTVEGDADLGEPGQAGEATTDAKTAAEILARLEDLKAAPAQTQASAASTALNAQRKPSLEPAVAQPASTASEQDLTAEAPAPEAEASNQAAAAAPEVTSTAARSHAPSRSALLDDPGHGQALTSDRAATTQIQAAVTPVAQPSAGGDAPGQNPGDGKAAEETLVAEAPAAEGTEQTSEDVAQSLGSNALAGAERPQHNAAAVIRGAPETVANLAAEILKKLDGRSTRFNVELDPIGLGRVDVRVEIGAQGRLTAAMTFDNPQALSELKSRAGELQKALEQAGFDLSGGLSFDFTGDRGQSGQSLADQQQDGGGASAWRGRAFQAALDVAVGATDTALGGLITSQRRADAGLDIRI